MQGLRFNSWSVDALGKHLLGNDQEAQCHVDFPAKHVQSRLVQFILNDSFLDEALGLLVTALLNQLGDGFHS